MLTVNMLTRITVSATSAMNNAKSFLSILRRVNPFLMSLIFLPPCRPLLSRHRFLLIAALSLDIGCETTSKDLGWTSKHFLKFIQAGENVEVKMQNTKGETRGNAKWQTKIQR